MERKRSDDGEKKTGRSPSGAAVMRPAVTDALTRALFVEWAAVGYGALRLERVAARACVGKAALYRRWPSKLAMTSECLARVGVTVTDIADQGSLEADIRALLLAARKVLRLSLVRRILPDLHAEIGRSPDLRSATRPFQAARREQVSAIINRAVMRGELRSTPDLEMAGDLFGAPLYWRMVVTGGTANRAYIDRLAGALAAMMKAGIS